MQQIQPPCKLEKDRINCLGGDAATLHLFLCGNNMYMYECFNKLYYQLVYNQTNTADLT